MSEFLIAYYTINSLIIFSKENDFLDREYFLLSTITESTENIARIVRKKNLVQVEIEKKKATFWIHPLAKFLDHNIKSFAIAFSDGSCIFLSRGTEVKLISEESYEQISEILLNE